MRWATISDNLKEQKVMEWYELYYKDLYRFIYYMLGDRQSCEDLVHDTFLRAYTSFEKFEKRASVKTWLFSIAKHLVFDEIRRRKRRRSITLFSEGKDIASPLNIEKYIENRDTVERSLKAIQQLKPDHRLVITLKKIEDCSTKEIVEILGWSESKIRKTLSRGLAELRKKDIAEGGGHNEQIF
ncbi:RNA polymerase sigma factor [Mesobacillus sp. AQ2]|jgi:RNA polymerase sigma-70 factor, ECF subfamily|uniref:RNA polymerase sigma factor n=1 Tax=unclassified Mesobacillus TaxID=2675270 RepID=UPI00203E82E8|nr:MULTISPECIES: RNA polymerase sigma factor [unclassified Mesobacillus]MCM3121879.1 RNA polymerase sigma factor [Mesobacillus sp. MER 33]MCM3231844.1 RNA polymerase sigma factor [Mesobacillus sp. MER 48]WHX38811.1 RNA polymerase sigma factor [Mesobacillus sp. AQ2]